jgi:hypothetical protein
MHVLGVATAVVVSAVALASSACGPDSSKPNIANQARQAAHSRADTYQKAVDQVPTPRITNFPRRKTLADSTVRQSLPNHPWYVYVLGQNGNIVNYFVAKSVPVNDCDYLSSTQDVHYPDSGTYILDAPSLEGIYQSASGCNTLTFFDLTTNAEIQVSTTNMSTYVTDRPLRVDAQPIKVRASK